RVRAEATGDDHAPVLGKRLADRVERLFARAVEEAARVDDDDVRAGVVRRGLVALGAQPGKDTLGIDERFRTAEADETYSRNDGHRRLPIAVDRRAGQCVRARAGPPAAGGGAPAPGRLF